MKGYKKCVKCGLREKAYAGFKKGKKFFCTRKCKKEYYANHVGYLKQHLQPKFNKLIASGQKCAKCGKVFPRMECSHILTVKAHDELRFDIFNALPMCGGCHNFWYHKEPLEAARWFELKYKDRYDYLMFAKHRLKKWTADELHKIKQAIKDKDFSGLLRFTKEYERLLAK